MTEPTPGPWKTRGCGIYAKSNLIACTGDDGDEQDGLEQLANARLIAAAPETAAERDRLKDLVSRIIYYYDAGELEMNSHEVDTGDPERPPHSWHEEWLHHARTAIAKACQQ